MHKQHPVAAGSRRIYRRQKMGFVLIHIAYFFLKLQDVSYFSCFTSINFSKPSWRILHTVVFSSKSHRSCGLVWNHPQDVVVFILNTASPWIIPERSTAPQHTRFILPPIHPTKSIAMLHGRYFSFTGNAPWKSHEPTERDSDFSSTPLHKQRQELRSEQTVTHIHEQHNLYLFFAP